MGSASAPLIARVSRRDLARNQFVWRATGGMTVYLGLMIGLLSWLARDEPMWQLVLIGALCIGVGYGLLRSQPPDLDTRFNHFVIALPYVSTAIIFCAAQDFGGIAVGAAMFIGPLGSVRLQNRKHFLMHLGMATACFSLAALIGQGTPSSQFGILCSGLAMWVLGISCWEVLQSAEAQGDELERLVRRDPLTGIGNRRLLDETLPEELERHGRTGKPLSILCLDLTGFKQLNDVMGHAEGDALLREVGGALAGIARPVDSVVRQGGDEFCLILADTTAEHAARTANAVRAALAELHFDGITTGIGIASYPEDAIDAATLLHVGDERLLADKAARAARRGDHPRRRASDRAADADRDATNGLRTIDRRGA